MAKIYFSAVLLFFYSLSSLAQTQLSLPQPSPKAKVAHTIGITDVTLEYSAPGVKKRQVWGNLVPYGKIWRAGANEATTITFSTPVRLGQETIPAGKYSVFVMPIDPANFQLILNSKTDLWGTDGYDPTLDVAKVALNTKVAPFQETLQYSITDVQMNGAQLNLNWENRQLYIPIRVESHALTLKALKDSLATGKIKEWTTYAEAVNYLLLQNSDHDIALDWVNKSIGLEENFYNTWLKARLLAQKNEFEAAWELSKRAQQLGKKAKEAYQAYAEEIEDAAVLWKERRFSRN